MKTSTRRWFGAAILGASLIGVELDLSNSPVQWSELHTVTNPDGSRYSYQAGLVEGGWPSSVLLLTGMAGLLLLVWPGSKSKLRTEPPAAPLASNPATPTAPPSDSVSVEFDFTPDDFIAFNLYHHGAGLRRFSKWAPFDAQAPFRSPGYLISMVIMALILVAMAWFFGAARGPIPGLIKLASFCLAASLTCGVLVHFFRWFTPRYFRWYTARMQRQGTKLALFGRQRVTLTPESMTVVSDLHHSTTRWPVVERVVSDGAYAYIYIYKIMAVVVPRRAFADDAAFAAFVQTAERHRKNAATPLL